MSKQKFVCFDIDATLHRGTRSGESLGECVARECIRRGLVPEEVLREADRLRAAYDRRHEAFTVYNTEFCTVLEEGFFSGLDARRVCEIAEEIAERERDRTHVFSRELLRAAHELGRAKIAISGSFYGVVQPFARSWGFDFVLGTEYDLDENGVYYGTRERVRVHARHKGRSLIRIVEREELSMESSIAIGDSLGDASMLEMVEYAILMNPDEQLLRHFERPRSSGRPVALIIEKRGTVFLSALHGDFEDALPKDVRIRLLEAFRKYGVYAKLL